jgi:hypothetical protein
MRYLPVLMSCLPLCLVTACASVAPDDGMLAVDTASGGQLMPGANCTVSTGSGSWNVTTPASIMVGSASGDLRVLCNKSGYRTSEVLYRPSSASNSNIGVGIGGGGRHVGAGLGFGFPISFGGGRYPSRITVDMTPQ